MIFDESSLFSETVERMDDAILMGEIFEPFIPLTLMTIFSKAPNLGMDLGQIFENLNEIDPFINQFFENLIIPRREKDKVSIVIKLIYLLYSRTSLSEMNRALDGDLFIYRFINRVEAR